MVVMVGSRARLKTDPEQEWFFVVDVDDENKKARLASKDEYLACSWPNRPMLDWEDLSFRP